jgi:DNA-binding transcriptional ArsR family regulator
MLKHSPVDRVFHALGDPTRRAIVEQLCLGPASATDLARPLGVTLAAVVQHLQVLERSGLIRTAKAGRTRTCHIELSGLQVAQQWLGLRRALWERRPERTAGIEDLAPSPDGHDA